MRRTAVGSALLALASVAVAIAAPGRSSADRGDQARWLDDQARREYARRHFDEALSLFLLAYDAAPNPAELYNIALCAELARRPELAFSYFEEYLATSEDDDARRADATRRLDALARRLAVVRVESDPPGATIRIDRRELGEWGTTPRTLALAPGPHVVLLERPDHQRAEVSIEAVMGERRTARATLAPRTGTLDLAVSPEGATLIVERDGAEVARHAAESGRAIELPVGAYEVRAEAPGHAPERIRVAIREGVAARRTMALEALPLPVGRVLVSSGAIHAEVWIDGRAVAETPAALRDVPAGVHRVEVRAAGFHPWSREVEVRDGGASYVDVDLTPLGARR